LSADKGPFKLFQPFQSSKPFKPFKPVEMPFNAFQVPSSNKLSAVQKTNAFSDQSTLHLLV
jgi:hypothetical protein